MTTQQPDNPHRRFMLKSSAMAVAFAASPAVNALQAMATKQRSGAPVFSSLADSPYGPVRPVRDTVTGLELLQLPAGFNYASFSWAGDTMSNGQSVPFAHDGMGVIAEQGDEIILVRNHELGAGPLISAPGLYDEFTMTDGQRAAGGNTNIHFSRSERREVRTVPSLGGTLANCAGGVTPWGTWLSCEETTNDSTAQGGRKHGYVFEVTADPAQTTGEPIVAMGRYKHEAAAVDPVNSYVYLTEDNRNMSPIYRFIPNDASQQAGALARGGRLQAAKVVGVERAELLAPALGDEVEIEWVDITDPDMAPDGDRSGPYLQSREAGALTISRGEGIRYSEGLFYLVDTSAGRNVAGLAGYGNGAVWLLDPAENRLRCLFASTDAVMGNNPDNITVSPRGGVVMCEDGGGVEDAFGFGERVMGLKMSGDTFVFAKNNIVLSEANIASAGKQCEAGDYRDQEIAGACFDAAGEFLFINIQTPGVTFAIWGPWDQGPL
jgi:secreted PhoX family phosphatase